MNYNGKKTDKNKIYEVLDKPHILEELYQSEPDSFKKIILSLAKENSESKVLQVWKARLEYTSKFVIEGFISPMAVFIIAIVFGLLIRVPEFFIDYEWYYPRFVPFMTMLSPSVYFLYKNRNTKVSITIAMFSLITILYVSLLPEINQSSSVAMALIHLPLTFLSLLAFSFLQEDWHQEIKRVAFIKYCGEIFILTVLILLGGGVFSALVVGLFEMQDLSIEDLYMQNIGILGVSSAPLVATYLYDSVLKRETFITTLLAKIFAPLFTFFVFSYLSVMVFMGNTPFLNRDFLIVFNGLLIVVLAIVIFSIVNRTRDGSIIFSDYINISLIFITLVINFLALSAIIFRLFEFGLSPNRFTVLGVNFLVFTHLSIMALAYIKVVNNKADILYLKSKVVQYLPIYAVWFAFISFFMPLFFSFA